MIENIQTDAARAEQFEFGFSFFPSAEALANLKAISIHFIEKPLLKNNPQVVTFWDDENLGFLKEKKLLFQRNNVFTYSKGIIYNLGITRDTKNFHSVSVCEPLGIPQQLSDNNVADYFKKNLVDGRKISVVETYVIRSIIHIYISGIRGSKIPPFIVKVFSGHNSKKSQQQSKAYQIDFGVIQTPTDNMGEGFEKVKNIFKKDIHILHPLVNEMFFLGRIQL